LKSVVADWEYILNFLNAFLNIAALISDLNQVNSNNDNYTNDSIGDDNGITSNDSILHDNGITSNDSIGDNTHDKNSNGNYIFIRRL
jgi:hypothetical protein